MSTIKSNAHQIGQSATATNNFTLYQPTSPDGTCRLAVGNSGATTSDVMTVANTGAVTFSGTVTATGGFIGAGLSLQSVQTSNFAAVKGNSYPVNTTSGAVTVTFPASPSAGDQINIFDYAGTAATNNITINPNGGKITGGTANVALNVQRISVTFTYVNSTQGWEPVTYNAYQNLNGKSWTYFTSSGTYVVPAGVTSVRGYAGGAGGNGASGAGGGGGGGGFAYGDIAVTPGQTMTVTISAGVATLAIGATTYLTGNAGGNASGITGGTAGTASKDASVTNGGAYSGGAGGAGYTSGGYAGGSGGSCGSPLGNGYAGSSGGYFAAGGAGIGGSGANGGGGAGGASVGGSGGGAGGPSVGGYIAGPSRAFNARFTDPLLVNAVSGGATSTYIAPVNYSTAAGPGGGGAYGGGSTTAQGGNGGDFGGGGGADYNNLGAKAGNGGLMGGGGGGSSYGTSGAVSPSGGNGGLGGGGGGCGNGGTAGTGGGAFVFIYA